MFKLKFIVQRCSVQRARGGFQEVNQLLNVGLMHLMLESILPNGSFHMRYGCCINTCARIIERHHEIQRTNFTELALYFRRFLLLLLLFRKLSQPNDLESIPFVFHFKVWSALVEFRRCSYATDNDCWCFGKFTDSHIITKVSQGSECSCCIHYQVNYF